VFISISRNIKEGVTDGQPGTAIRTTRRTTTP
jgi:hypothetical protein